MIVEDAGGRTHRVQPVKFTSGMFGIQDYVDENNWLVCDAADPSNDANRYEVRVRVEAGRITSANEGEFELVDGPIPEQVRKSLEIYCESLMLAA